MRVKTLKIPHILTTVWQCGHICTSPYFYSDIPADGVRLHVCCRCNPGLHEGNPGWTCSAGLAEAKVPRGQA